MKNCAVAECGRGAGHGDGVGLVLQAVVGFVLDGALVSFCFMPGSKPPPWIMKPLITRWKMVP
jgi:predicted sugar kinase